MLLSHQSNSAIGFDIGTTTIKVAQIQKIAPGQFKLVNYAILETMGHMEHFNNAIQSSSLKPLSADLMSYITVIREKMQLSSHVPITVSLPSYGAFTTLLDLPDASHHEINRSLPENVAHYIPTPIETVSLDWIKVGEKTFPDGKKKQTVLIVSVPNEKIDAYKEVFQAAKLNLVGCEIENASLARAITRSSLAPTLIIDIGGRSTSLSVGQKGTLEFVGQTDFSSGSLTQALATGLNISLERADQLKKRTNIEATGGEQQLSTIMRPIIDVIINEADRIKDAFEKSYNRKVENIILTGAGANMPGFVGYVSTKINTPVGLGNPFEGILYPPELENFIPELKSTLAVSLGLALKQLI
ncbi:MAG: hypothetical protein COU10_01530 [Candidatus Harrisonbacteria bacterium CG10_big_fil_rev_8_21_14_0_10_45_28]|uniref:SHS2 domain-containing protein n=1 Tax=Candidatus Harrisonbacteria bacterium CG10_big_fil_rev_8_21_14_0_10_45_28 TaxID=1974586 RepID=A0A2H0UQD8_9BACT|nr:MAG: hypothetical protein COU10_01530 [Candidatus Harrisonbacteria bacterium CG10_big_fil_rev_8_21_14_0_10_45_28]